MILMDTLSELLWYRAPAENWDEALPVGNGRLGGMVFGRPSDELIELNEDSIWSGGYKNRNNPKARDNLEKMRALVREGKTEEANKLCEEAFFAEDDQMRQYRPLGSLHIKQDCGNGPDIYERHLELDGASCGTYWTADDAEYGRNVFASHPDNVIVIFFAANRRGRISFTACIDGRDGCFDSSGAYDESTLLFEASDGIPFSAAVSVSAVGGKAYAEGKYIKVENADEAVLTIACQTAYRTADHKNLAVSQAKAAIRRGRSSLVRRHLIDYTSLYDRCSLSLSDNSSGNASLPTDERLEKFREGGKDNKLIEMYFNFSRYLMISGSREGTLPLNLQGIWNKDMQPAWGSKYTVNINTEMNYWGAEMLNLSCCHMPLFDHIERMREHGRVTAREMYGCGGTVCHHNTDIWGDTAPQDRWLPGTLWPTGMAWLCTHIYEHYLFTGDRAFLAEKYDTMKEAAEFFVDFLTENEKGQLVTNPSVSPENTYITKDGAKGMICEGPSMDSRIIHCLFTAVINSAEILRVKDGFADKLRELRGRLPKPEAGSHGQLMEWAEDYDEAEPGHRHISHLFALYPCDMITPRHTPELARAAEVTLERRLSNGGGHTGWSRAWIINMFARLGKSEAVYENIAALLGHSTSINMFDMHPPFQIDGNFGGGAGIAEAIIQSHSGEIFPLPALPKEWESGAMRGMIARGGFELDLEWSGGKPISLCIISTCGNPCRIVGTQMSVTCGGETVPIKEENGAVSFETETGGVYFVRFHAV